MRLTGNEAAVLATLAGVLLTAFFMFGAWLVQKLTVHDTALKLLIQQVNPLGEKSLREMLNDINIQMARLEKPPG